MQWGIPPLLMNVALNITMNRWLLLLLSSKRPLSTSLLLWYTLSSFKIRVSSQAFCIWSEIESCTLHTKLHFVFFKSTTEPKESIFCSLYVQFPPASSVERLLKSPPGYDSSEEGDLENQPTPKHPLQPDRET